MEKPICKNCDKEMSPSGGTLGQGKTVKDFWTCWDCGYKTETPRDRKQFTWYGKSSDDMSREELIDAILKMQEQIEEMRSEHARRLHILAR